MYKSLIMVTGKIFGDIGVTHDDQFEVDLEIDATIGQQKNLIDLEGAFNIDMPRYLQF